MKRHWLIPLSILLSCVKLTSAADPVSSARVRQTVDRAMAFLEDDMLAWRTEHGCAACHHGPLYVWSNNIARAQGYPVHTPVFDEVTHWLLTNDATRIFPKPSQNPNERPRLSQSTIFVAQALTGLPTDHPDRLTGWQRVGEHLVAAQNANGSWAGSKGSPPIFNTPTILTMQAATALHQATHRQSDQHSDPDAVHDRLPNDEALRMSLNRASAWLKDQPSDETHQGLVLRLLWNAQTAASPDANSEASNVALISELRSLQRADGGWSQSADRPSDAFATGQTLFSLRAAGVAASDPCLARGIAFLTDTQRPDGTWPMTSRPDPTDGKPSTNLNPITYAAMAWATVGLATCVPFQGDEHALRNSDAATPKFSRKPNSALLSDCPIGQCPGRGAASVITRP